MESNSLSWPVLTWYLEIRSSKIRNFYHNWYSCLLDAHFTLRWFSKYWPYPLSLRSFAVFWYFFIDTFNWSFSRPFRAFKGKITSSYVHNFVIVCKIANWYLDFRRPSMSILSGSITCWPFCTILAFFGHANSLIVHSRFIDARMYKFIPLNAYRLRWLIFSLRRSKSALQVLS